VLPDEIANILACPRCHARLTHTAQVFKCGNDACDLSKSSFHSLGSTPVLVDYERSILDRNQVQATEASSTIPRGKSRVGGVIKRIIFGNSPVTERNEASFLAEIKKHTQRPVVLVVGGASIGPGIRRLYEDQDICLVGFDIYASSNTAFIGDAHQIPLIAESVDGVWIQAVLEHVLEPYVVVGEIFRVLKANGLVYSETPFLQQVHEGAYDFSRLTHSGHRWLYRDFSEVDSGVVAGPGTQLLWSIDYLFRSLFRSRAIGKCFKVSVFWLRFLDLLVDRKRSLDSASCCYFLGRKTGARPLQPRDMPHYYGGAG